MVIAAVNKNAASVNRNAREAIGAVKKNAASEAVKRKKVSVIASATVSPFTD